MDHPSSVAPRTKGRISLEKMSMSHQKSSFKRNDIVYDAEKHPKRNS